MKEHTKKYFLVALILGCAFALMYTLNAWMPIHRDDYEYSLIWNTTTHITSMSDVLTSVYRHYMLHGGRVVTVFFLDSFLLLGKFWFDLANAFLFVAVVYLCYAHALRKITCPNPKLLTITALLTFLCLPHFGEVVVWKSGSTVYLWSAFFVILFLLPYNLQLLKPLKHSGLFALPMFILGLAAGWSVENLGVTTVVLSSALSLYTYKYRPLLPLWMPAGALGALFGLIGMVAAPGNFVRYTQQGQNKGMLIHIGNQFAGNGEMLLYVLPLVLLFLLGWTILKQELAGQQKLKPSTTLSQKDYLKYGGMLLLIFVFVYSYFNGGFIASSIRDFLIAHALHPLGLIKKNTIHLFSNVMAGFEEMVIYWCLLFLIYAIVKKLLGFSPSYLKLLRSKASNRAVLQAFPEVKYSLFFLALALFNNLVMLAAPTFPARATFSSVLMLIIGLIALFKIPAINAGLLSGAPGKALAHGSIAIGGFIAVAALVITNTMFNENAWRLKVIAAQAQKAPHSIVTLPPITITNRALRHVYFEDFYNNVTKEGLCRYYGLKDIKVPRTTRGKGQ